MHSLAHWLVLVFALIWPSLASAQAPSTIPRLLSDPTAFQTLVNPKCSHCRDEAKRRGGELRDDDRVLCWIRGYSDGGAIPIRFFLNSYRVISDSYGVFVYDPDAGFARGFAPSYDFSFEGWRNGVMVMKHKDGTLFSCLSGKGFEGPRTGTQLEVVPTLVSDWGNWLKAYPQTVTYEMFDKYKPIELPQTENERSRRSRGIADSRLPADEVVLGVAEGDQTRAYRLKQLRGKSLIHDSAADQQWVVLWNEATRTAAAYSCIAHPPEKADGRARRLTIRLDSSHQPARVVDQETKSHWDITGRAVEGELKGWSLEWLNGTQVKWFAWAAEYPRTTIHNE